MSHEIHKVWIGSCCCIVPYSELYSDSSRDHTDPMEAIASHEMQAGLCAGEEDSAA